MHSLFVGWHALAELLRLLLLLLRRQPDLQLALLLAALPLLPLLPLLTPLPLGLLIRRVPIRRRLLQ